MTMMSVVHTNRWAAALLALLMVTAMGGVLTGCSIFGKDDSDIEGIWELSGADQAYIHITKTTITSYDFMGDSVDDGDDCYEIDVLNIVSHEGDNYTVSAPDFEGFQITIQIKRVGDQLRVSVLGESETYDKSSKAVSSFTPECEDDFFGRGILGRLGSR